MEKMDTFIGKECIKLLSSCKMEICFLKIINSFQNFQFSSKCLILKN